MIAQFNALVKGIRAKTIGGVIRRLNTIFRIVHNESPEEINSGHCEDFAQAFLTRFPDALATWGDEYDDEFWGLGEEWANLYGSYHCFVALAGKFYDSECPQGVDHPRDLPYFQREIAWQERYT